MTIANAAFDSSERRGRRISFSDLLKQLRSHTQSDGSLRDADLGAAQAPRGLAETGSAFIKRIQYYTACWSTGRNARYPYYLCDTRGCVAFRKSIRRDVIEGEFEALLRTLMPSEGQLNLAVAMFRDLWDAKLAGKRAQGATLENDIRAIEHKIEGLRDRIVEASGASLIAAHPS